MMRKGYTKNGLGTLTSIITEIMWGSTRNVRLGEGPYVLTLQKYYKCNTVKELSNYANKCKKFTKTAHLTWTLVFIYNMFYSGCHKRYFALVENQFDSFIKGQKWWWKDTKNAKMTVWPWSLSFKLTEIIFNPIKGWLCQILLKFIEYSTIQRRKFEKSHVLICCCDLAFGQIHPISLSDLCIVKR